MSARTIGVRARSCVERWALQEADRRGDIEHKACKVCDRQFCRNDQNGGHLHFGKLRESRPSLSPKTSSDRLRTASPFAFFFVHKCPFVINQMSTCGTSKLVAATEIQRLYCTSKICVFVCLSSSRLANLFTSHTALCLGRIHPRSKTKGLCEVYATRWLRVLTS